MSNLTVIGYRPCCGKKYTEHEKVYKNPIGIPGKRENLCAFCYNYKKPKTVNSIHSEPLARYFKAIVTEK